MNSGSDNAGGRGSDITGGSLLEAENSYDRGKKKRTRSTTLETGSLEEEDSMEEGTKKSLYKETILDANPKGCSLDSWGSGVFEDEWTGNIDSLKGFFWKAGQSDEGVASGNEESIVHE